MEAYPICYMKAHVFWTELTEKSERVISTKLCEECILSQRSRNLLGAEVPKNLKSRNSYEASGCLYTMHLKKTVQVFHNFGPFFQNSFPVFNFLMLF